VTRLEELVVGRWRLGAAALVAAALTATIGAAPQQPQRAAGTVHSNVRAVLVDVVVHDKKGEPVRDLTESDFQITEDGVPQKIASFTPVMEGTPRPRTAPSAPTLPSTATVGSAAPVEAGPIVTALLFDRLGPESRRLAVQAAQDYVGSKSQASSYVGIFGIETAWSRGHEGDHRIAIVVECECRGRTILGRLRTFRRGRGIENAGLPLVRRQFRQAA